MAQPTGRIVAAGSTGVGGAAGLAVARFDRFGKLDRTFSGGTSVISAGAPSIADALASEPDGKIVVGGTRGSGDASESLLARYTSKGALDPTFGASGLVVRHEGDNGIAAIAVQPDGKIVTAGWSSDRVRISRYRPDGSLDPSFGKGGDVETIFGGRSLATSLALQRDGGILITTSTSLPNPHGVPVPYYETALLRFTAEGALDSGFGVAGKVEPPPDTGAGSVHVQPDGKILVTGGFSFLRYRPDGSLDTTFGSGGKAELPFPVGLVAVQPDGKIVGASSILNERTNWYDFGVTRVKESGSIDAAFGNDGVARVEVGPLGGRVTSVALQPDGKILVAGGRTLDPASLDSEFVVARFRKDGSVDAGFGRPCDVPNLIGLSISRARNHLEAANCRLGRIRRRPSTKRPGRVIGQTPRPRTRWASATPVSLVVSR
jgi:uncharacterized delta-60 repeat protein